MTSKEMAQQFNIKWLDRGREPQNPPDPRYPNGIAVDLSAGAAMHCTVELPYPAARCGVWLVRCLVCGTSVAITAAGRADDPRSVELACDK